MTIIIIHTFLILLGVAGKKKEDNFGGKNVFGLYWQQIYCSFKKYVVLYPSDKIKYHFLQFIWSMSDFF